MCVILRAIGTCQSNIFTTSYKKKRTTTDDNDGNTRENADKTWQHTDLLINALAHVKIQHLRGTVLEGGVVVDLLLKQLDVLNVPGYIVASEDVGGGRSEITQLVVVVGEEDVFDFDVPMKNGWIAVVEIRHSLKIFERERTMRVRNEKSGVQLNTVVHSSPVP